ncbi:MAG: hypothetical protein PHQ36_05490 [Anaerolineales bacterium]|nr:hypothetical protein [Anaerolineales bacterium]
MSRKLFLIPLYLLAVSILVIGSLPVPVQAQEGDPEGAGNVILIDSNLQTPSNPDIAWGPACGKFLVVYDRKVSNTDYNIWGRYINSDGSPYLAPFRITSAATKQANPAVAWNQAGGNYMVAWEDFSAGHWQIYAQRWGCKKLGIGGAVALAPAAVDTTQRLNPDVACGYFTDITRRGCWVVWEDLRNLNLSWDIYGQWVSHLGVPAGGGNIRISLNASSQRYPAITQNPESTGCKENSFMVAWTDARNTAVSGFDIYSQQLDNIGRCGLNLPVTRNAGNQMYPDLAYGTVNNAYQVVWQDYRNVNTDIYARRINSAGGGMGADFALSNPPTNQSRPAVCYSTNAVNQFNTVWHDNRVPANLLGIYGQRSVGNGVLIGTPANVNYLIVNSANNETRPAIAYSSVSNRYFVVWVNSTTGIEGRAIWWP